MGKCKNLTLHIGETQMRFHKNTKSDCQKQSYQNDINSSEHIEIGDMR